MASRGMRSALQRGGVQIQRLLYTNAHAQPLCAAAPPPPPQSAAGDLGNVGVPLRHQQRKKIVRWGAIGLGFGAAFGVAYGYDKARRAKSLVANPSDETSYILDAVPAHTPSRTRAFPTDTSGLKLTLFQYQTCPFCCKVRAMLDFFGISYDIVEVNPVLRSQIKWSQTYKKVPILVVQTPQGEVLQLNDSSMIVSALYSYLVANKSQSSPSSESGNSMYNIAKFYPTIKYNDEGGRTQSDIMNKYFLMLGSDSEHRSKEEIAEERKWRLWTDSVFVHTLSPNIYRTIPEAIESFKNFDRVGEWEKNFATWERYLVIYVGAFAMWLIGKRLQKRHNLKNEVRLSLYEEGDYWMKQIEKKGGEFMGGTKPNLSDLAVYGVLNSIEGCTAFNDLMKHSKPLKEWYGKIKSHLRYGHQQL